MIGKSKMKHALLNRLMVTHSLHSDGIRPMMDLRQMRPDNLNLLCSALRLILFSRSIFVCLTGCGERSELNRIGDQREKSNKGDYMFSLKVTGSVFLLVALYFLGSGCADNSASSVLGERGWSIVHHGEMNDRDQSRFLNAEVCNPEYHSERCRRRYARPEEPGNPEWLWSSINNVRSARAECGAANFHGISGPGPVFAHEGCDDPKKQGIEVTREEVLLTSRQIRDFKENHVGNLRLRIDGAFGINSGWASTNSIIMQGAVPSTNRWTAFAKVWLIACGEVVSEQRLYNPDRQEWVPVDVPLDIGDFDRIINNCSNLKIRVEAFGSEVHFHQVSWSIWEKF